MIRLASCSNSAAASIAAGKCKRTCFAPAMRPNMACRSMSVRPEDAKKTKEGDVIPRRKVTIQRLKQMKEAETPIAMLTAYDYPTGRACEEYGVDITLVGDSLAQVCLGYDSTTRLTLNEMLYHCRAVGRGSKNPFLVADMPFGSYHAGPEDTIRNAVRMVQEGGVEGVKLEGGEEIQESVRRLTGIGIPVMGHVGLLPQRHTASSGYRVQGKDASSASTILRAARALEDAGAFAVVLEAVPSKLGEYITANLRIPTIGIGAGSATSGQVLVWDDMVGTWSGHKAKFVRRFADAKGEHRRGVLDYVAAVKQRTFPDESESYAMDGEQWERFSSGPK
ncbi:ketopantoate hydroxymethyltransferase-domain-containing protein [Phellopilus nigrolimitatus]|nr:ketopantoate hydroxymethyltransferase-domain-containing protein [Phellopilus nigrolimitatus]